MIRCFCAGNPRKYLDAFRAHRQSGIGHRFHFAAPILPSSNRFFDGHFILTVRKHLSQFPSTMSPNEPLTDAMALFFVRLAGGRRIRLAPPHQDQESSLGAQGAGGRP
jgi:hypothetical protein